MDLIDEIQDDLNEVEFALESNSSNIINNSLLLEPLANSTIIN